MRGSLRRVKVLTFDRLNNSHIYHQIMHDTKSRGIDVNDVKLNLPNMLKAKNNSVKQLTGGIETYLFKKYGVDYIKGKGSFASPSKINVALNEGGETQIEAKNVIIATGSEVTPFPGIEIDEERIVSSTGALDLKEVPKKASRLSRPRCIRIVLIVPDGRYWWWYYRPGARFRVEPTRCGGHCC